MTLLGTILKLCKAQAASRALFSKGTAWNHPHLSPTDLSLLVHFAAVEMFVAFVTTHPLLRAGQDKQTPSDPKDSISLGNKSLVAALWHMGL